MSPQPEPGQIVVRFDPPGSTNLAVYAAPDVTIGQMGLAGHELVAIARDARQADLARRAQEAMQLRTLAAGLRNGGK